MPRVSSPPSDVLTDTWGRRNRKLGDAVCPACGKSFRPARATSRYCSRPCMWSKNGGHNKKPETWWTDNKGYIVGRVRRGDLVKHVKKHRAIIEQHLGRRLLPGEDVHHINGDKADNRVENLQVISHADHTRLTNQRPYKRGYKLNLSDSERQARSERMRDRRAISKATGA